MVVYARSPVLPELLNHTAVFRNDMLPWNELHICIARTSIAIGGEVAKFDERVSPKIGGKRVFEHLLEPSLVEIVVCLFVLITLCIDQFEGLRHDESYTLANTAR